MKLLLMRHAEADSINPERYPDDDLRPLTRQGCEIHEKVSKALRRMDIKLNRIISSPRLRAMQTADITARELSMINRMTLSDVLAHGYSVTSMLSLLRTCSPTETVLCVGHDPDLCQLSGALLGTAARNIKFPKSAVMGIRFNDVPDAGKGVLSFFYRPQDLLPCCEFQVQRMTTQCARVAVTI